MVHFDAYDWVVINSSSGKDSAAMLAVVAQMAQEQEVPRSRLVVAHADLSLADVQRALDAGEQPGPAHNWLM